MALKLQEEYADTLQTVFVEVGRSNDAQMQAFAIDKGWMGKDGSRRAIWTKERPFDVGAGGIPAFALMDENGKVLLTGITTRKHSEIEEIIEQYAKDAKKPPKDLPKSVGKAKVDFGKGKYGSSLVGLRKLAETPDARDAELQPAAEAMLASLEGRLERELARADWRMANGHYAQAEEQLKDLAKGLKGADDWLEKVQERIASLDSGDLAAEKKAAGELDKLVDKLFSKGTDKVKPASLRKIGDKYPGTKAAARAEKLIAVVEAGG